MYEKFTAYLDSFGNGGVSGTDLSGSIQAFVSDFSQSELMDPNGMELMGSKGWATRSALKNDIPGMSAEEVCACLSTFVLQESFCPGILQDLINQDILPKMLERLKALDG